MSGTEDPLTTVLDEVATALPRLLTRTRRQLEVGRNALGLVVCRRLPPAPRSVSTGSRERVPLTVVDVVAEDWTSSVAAEPVGDAGSTVADGAPGPIGAAGSPGATSPAVPAPAVDPAPPAGELALEDYDVLAASQVVPRLASLSPGELDTVRRYERAHRNRQTILNRVEQLLGDSD